MAYARLYPNQLGTIITYLQMTARPTGTAEDRSADFRLERLPDIAVERYKALFLRAGQDWLWFVNAADDEVRTLLRDPNIDAYAVRDRAGEDVGMFELHFSAEGECMIQHLAFIPSLIGKGRGRWLLDQALRLAWRDDVKRVRLSTCTLDHPRALGFYLKAGFVPYRRSVGSFVDPRLTGVLPRTAAAHVPIIEVETPTRQEPPKPP